MQTFSIWLKPTTYFKVAPLIACCSGIEQAWDIHPGNNRFDDQLNINIINHNF